MTKQQLPLMSATRIYLLVASLAALFCLVSSDCNVQVDQTLGSSWVQDGVPQSQWNARVLVTGSDTVTSLVLAIGGSANIVQLWGLDLVSGRNYRLPDYIVLNGGLASGQQQNWGYIWQSASQAPVSVVSIQCAGSSPGPSPSSSPVASSPGASPSSSPVAPSPGASPTHGPCQLSITQTTRSASAGGSWTVGDTFFQIYDLALLNSGSSAITSAVIAINLASGDQSITQFWNLGRQSATSNQFNVLNPGGNIEVGATLGAGFIVSSPVSAGPQVPPSTVLVSVTCAGVSTPQPSSLPTSQPSSQPSASPPSSGCSLVLSSIVARSAANGGSWTTGPGQFFQIFDINFTNNGQRPVNGAVVTFSLPVAGSSISQWWELNRQDNTLAFNVAFNFGPLQVGASQGAGIVVMTSSPSQAVPSVDLSNVSCA